MTAPTSVKGISRVWQSNMTTKPTKASQERYIGRFCLKTEEDMYVYVRRLPLRESTLCLCLIQCHWIK